MASTFYDASISALVLGLTNLSHLIDKAIEHARVHGIEPSQLVQARLAPDMLPFSGQVQRASDTAKFAGTRLSLRPAPVFADDEVTLEALKERVGHTVDYLLGIPASALAGAQSREIRFKAGPAELQFSADDYVRKFVLPNFYFHVTTAYALLRHQGVAIGKMDYLGRIQ